MFKHLVVVEKKLILNLKITAFRLWYFISSRWQEWNGTSCCVEQQQGFKYFVWCNGDIPNCQGPEEKIIFGMHHGSLIARRMDILCAERKNRMLNMEWSQLSRRDNSREEAREIHITLRFCSRSIIHFFITLETPSKKQQHSLFQPHMLLSSEVVMVSQQFYLLVKGNY